MIREDYVSFEVAKLLKEKGLDGKVSAYYHIWDNGSYVCTALEFMHSEAPHLYIPAPTLQMAMKWLREVHSLSVEVQFFLNEENGISSWNYDIIDIITYCNKARYAMCVNFETYEQACEAAIKYCLENLI